ncbi:MAG: polyphosphate kinase 1 [Anaerolineae bacterium]|nr:polyphosphate kinase 1 [Anaerolineae bacterium]
MSSNGHSIAPPVQSDASLYLNRELALLDFSRRVLEEACDERNPLLERCKFLAIVGSNIAEVFMVRVAGLKQQVEAGIVERSLDGQTPAEQLVEIRRVAHGLMRESRVCLRQLVSQLSQAGIHLLDYTGLDDGQRAAADAYFEHTVFPVLTPLAHDPARPFPHISNMSLNLAIIIRDQQGRDHFARLKVPSLLPRFVPIKAPAGAPAHDGLTPPTYFVWLEQVIAANLPLLFPGLEIVESYPFRVTRDAEMVIQELEAEDLLESVERGVRQRRFGSVVRMTITEAMPSHVRDVLVENMDLDDADIYSLEPPLGMSDLMGLYKLERPDLKYPPFAPTTPPELDLDADIFAAIRRQDILLHHPYDSFNPVIEFLQTAAHDPSVLAIKMTLYRVGKNSPVVQALLDAVHNGKQVAVLVELKARFDEESNIEWAKQLESEGVHVVYGLLGLKTHSKIALVVRQEGDGIRRYVHLSTGNYNALTAQIYTDIGLLTCDEAMGADASDVFNYLTGYSGKRDYRRFLVAPINLRACLTRLIEREIEHARAGSGGYIFFKTNSLVDKQMIDLLYRASQAGVKLDLLVRGMCCLRPGLAGSSDNIRVISILGRFLEHSRVYYFRNGGQDEVYLGSADVRTRNLDRRVEILFPLQDPRFVQRMRDQIIATYLADTAKARLMQPDGTYIRVQPAPGAPAVDCQQAFIQQHAALAQEARRVLI